jgi:hypothetical protein
MKNKVTKVTKFDKKDNYGNTSFSIEFANGDKGFYTSKSEEQTKFVVGQEADYNIEKKEGKEGKVYYKITLPDSGNAFGKGGGFKAPEPRIQMISFAAAYCKDIIVAGKADLKDFDTTFDKIYNKMISKL